VVPLGFSRTLALLGILGLARELVAQQRVMRPDDLFRIERVGAITWSPDQRRATVEISRPGRWIDPGIPTARIALVEAASGTLRTISPASHAFVGFFGAAWSQDSRRLLFLSVDTNAVVRPWLWEPGAGEPKLLPGLELHDGLVDPPVALWSDSSHAVFMVRDSASPRDGPLYFKINRGRNVADEWARAREGRYAAVTVLESRGMGASTNSAVDTTSGLSRIVSVDLRSHAVTTIARGALHLPRMSGDGRTLTYWRENPPLAAAAASSYFGPEARGEKAYDMPNFGNEIHHVDPLTGAPVPPPDTARRSETSASAPALRVASADSSGTQLLLSRPGKPDVELWLGNRWAREIVKGRAESIAYTSRTGAALTGWLLYPPGHVAGRKIPIVTVVYPGNTYGERAPPSFSVLNSNFEHPQLFAASGYGVLIPSMPAPENPLKFNGLDSLTAGVLPLLDTLIARGIADSTRIAVLGQSAGGYGTIGLITQTDRFRTAIASASYADLVSLYGTFYGMYRHGDLGNPQKAQILRMLQFERGFYGADAPPWEAPELYRLNSPLWNLSRVHTPLMLVQGDMDFIPIQQAEEVFTSLYRQDKRVRLVRYAGEEHTITSRANVLDLWERMLGWLRETMPPR
jgi:dipeptidyl aminopeptidase/acylaminoacyl peptidase